MLAELGKTFTLPGGGGHVVWWWGSHSSVGQQAVWLVVGGINSREGTPTFNLTYILDYTH